MFRKVVKIEPAKVKMNHKDSMITLGSCFSDTIGHKLELSRFNVMLNPFGTIFHPNALAALIEGVNFHDTILRDGVYFHWNLGGNFYDENKDEITTLIRELSESFEERIKRTSFVFVTFGTAWGYVLKETEKIVANCHKQPQHLFDKRLFSVDEILAAWRPIVERFNSINWVFTVSPVRHWKDGVRENNVSKGILHQVVHQLLSYQNVSYFPAYEILLDELRDYRFYGSDFLHPSQEAIDYIWLRFKETYFDSKTCELVERIEHLEESKNHKIKFPNSTDGVKFKKELEARENQVLRMLSEYQV